MIAAAGATMRAFSMDRAANPWSDSAMADVLMLAGNNVAECFPEQIRCLWDAKDRGAKLVVVDPRVTPTGRAADLHLQMKCDQCPDRTSEAKKPMLLAQNTRILAIGPKKGKLHEAPTTAH